MSALLGDTMGLLKLVVLMFLIVVYFLSSNLHAQKIEEAGVKLGRNYSTMFGPGQNLAWKESLSFGGYVFIGFGNNLGLQLEFLYISNGYKKRFDFSGPGHEAFLWWNFNYLQMPLLGKWLLRENSRVSVASLIGPTFARKSSDSIEIGAGLSEMVDFSTHRLDVGVTVQSDVGINLAKGKMVFSPRYYHGLREVRHSEGRSGLKNRAFTLMLGYAYTR